MSPPSTDSLFDQVDFEASEPTAGYDPMQEEAVYGPEPPAPVQPKRAFDAYSMLLLLSFLATTIAAILFFVEAGKY